jgi:hypothetical protein
MEPTGGRRWAGVGRMAGLRERFLQIQKRGRATRGCPIGDRRRFR